MAEYWDNPHTFDPERWLEPRNEHKRHPFSFVGFGGGAHKCIGMHFALMQTKNFLHQFLRRFEAFRVIRLPGPPCRPTIAPAQFWRGSPDFSVV